MYSLRDTASVLGVAIITVRKWIKKDGIEIEVLETDRKRIYITYNDVLALAEKHIPLPVKLPDQNKPSSDLKGLYSIEDAAELLGVKYGTLKKWLGNSGIEKKKIRNGRKSTYISYSDLLALAEMHHRTIIYNKGVTEQNGNAQEASYCQEEKLYTVEDAVLFLGVTETTVRQWLSEYKIAKKTVGTDRKQISITYGDIILLAQKQKREPVCPINIGAHIKEIKYRLEKIETAILKLEEHLKGAIYLD